MGIHTVISISRQFGSGGREIGREVAAQLSIPFYDSALIRLAAEKSGMSEKVLENLDEKAANRFLYTMPSGISTLGHASTAIYNMPLSDTLFLTQYEIIKQLAAEGPCVIVGRCSDYILKENHNHISVFIHADESFRAERIAEYEKISKEDAMSRISKYDRERKKYHDYYAAGTWGIASFYDLTINSGLIGIQNSVRMVLKFVNLLEQEAKQ
ncbi:MAG: cytidylate kinase-like family protein [Sphaerochaetaceae bacterium]|jgi:cytidylate kinase|nr:cytidylate kinase-like family protein [Sphaerochaetaceae bacterium]NLO59849.1 cytidylate kinase-like family protein [Spirochaetales bacterium]MDD2406282.1 cytidylate kinase-like family protein [Sphaerochaetaceae bacterium]MDD3670676.1 cytidylate kinase-like family protein [Sphaerochaetaceae bacterium]MDD4260215.1 cytidylate kinase-like family protein [Sphaerochaetaceae bacterium]